MRGLSTDGELRPSQRHCAIVIAPKPAPASGELRVSCSRAKGVQMTRVMGKLEGVQGCTEQDAGVAG